VTNTADATSTVPSASTTGLLGRVDRTAGASGPAAAKDRAASVEAKTIGSSTVA